MKINRVSLYLLSVDLLVAFQEDPAGHNMAQFLSQKMHKKGDVFRGSNYDLVEISTPAISADWLEDKFHYDAFVFLSKHAAESGVLALTCHSTGNFSKAKFGGHDRQVAKPYPSLQKKYLQELYSRKDNFADFQITIEATHHGPTALSKPTIFIEIGTTPKQWNDVQLCNKVAQVVDYTLQQNLPQYPVGICFGGTHYPDAFTKQLLYGEFALGTVIPKHALDFLDNELFSHILHQNSMAKAALLDWGGLGQNKQKVLDLLATTDLEVIKL